jgi:hypothetical protein
MRHLFTLSILLLTTLTTTAQEDHPATIKDTSNYYYKSLRICLADHYRSTPFFNFATRKVDGFYHVFVEGEYSIVSDLPLTIDSFKIEYVTTGSLRKTLRKRQKITVHKIFPMHIEGNVIKMGIVHFGVSKRKKVLWYENGSGCSFEYTFDCDKRSFILSRYKSWGI